MKTQIEEEIKEIMAEILDTEEEIIDDTFSPDVAENWDSLNNLKMITALEDNFEINLTMEEINSMVNFSKIKSVILSKIN